MSTMDSPLDVEFLFWSANWPKTNTEADGTQQSLRKELAVVMGGAVYIAVMAGSGVYYGFSCGWRVSFLVS